MESYKLEKVAGGRSKVRVPYRGATLLHQPMYNKGTAFTDEERHAFQIAGLMPHHIFKIDEQLPRVYEAVARRQEDIEKYIGLAGLHDRNEILFYRLVLDHIEEFLPIVYTPTVGQACQQFSHIFRRGRGLWITPDHQGRIETVLGNAPFQDIRLIVVTDNERILGLGDQGAGGMGIPVGKLALYTLAAGIHPAQCLPISLDVGTDNQELLADPLYLGWRQPRLRGEPYYELVEEFVTAVQSRFPKALLQWEDFKKQNAFTLLDRYRERLLSFNDDIQGTAAVALAGMMAANRVTGLSMRDHHVVILGAGAAGIGIARQLRDAMQRDGLEGDELAAGIALLDSRGLLVNDREIPEEYKREFAWSHDLAVSRNLGPDSDRSLVGTIRTLGATVLIGTSGQPGIFTEEVVRAIAEGTPRPLVFPYSNPTSKSEATPENILRWSDGRALVATGSPFEPVKLADRTVKIGQGNNVYVFPGVGLGALAAGARTVPDSMFTVAAQALARHVNQEDLDSGSLYPPLGELRELTAEIATAVAREACNCGVADPLSDDEIAARVADNMWVPEYPDYEPA